MKRIIFEDEEEFDTVILLDACRWDYYTEFRNCNPGWSPGNTTGESIPEMFPSFYPNTVYISGNPLINSIKTPSQFFIRDYKPKDHFIQLMMSGTGAGRRLLVGGLTERKLFLRQLPLGISLSLLKSGRGKGIKLCSISCSHTALL